MSIDLMPGETPLERAKIALRRTANLVAFHADMDAIVLYDTRGTGEETYWRHLWLYIVRTGLDVAEADIAAAFTQQCVALGIRKSSDAPFHHDSVANACHHIEDLIEDGDAAAEVEWLVAQVVEHWRRGRLLRERLDAARPKLKRQRKKDREAARQSV